MRTARRGGRNLVSVREIGNAAEHEDQAADDDRERGLRGFGGGLTEGTNAIANGFDPGQRSTAARKRFQDEPETEGLDRMGRRGRRDDRMRMSAADQCLENAPDNRNEHGREKQVCRSQEDASGLAYPSQVDDRNDRERSQAKEQRFRMQ